jgi:hypothetical protein
MHASNHSTQCSHNKVGAVTITHERSSLTLSHRSTLVPLSPSLSLLCLSYYRPPVIVSISTLSLTHHRPLSQKVHPRWTGRRAMTGRRAFSSVRDKRGRVPKRERGQRRRISGSASLGSGHQQLLIQTYFDSFDCSNPPTNTTRGRYGCGGVPQALFRRASPRRDID